MATDRTLFFREDTSGSVNLGLELDKIAEEPRENILATQRAKKSAAGEDRLKMSPNPTLRERRQWKRFAIEGAVVMVEKPRLLPVPVLKAAYVMLGPVKDISMKGLAVHYVESKEQSLKKAQRLSIKFPGGDFIVNDLPFKIVNTFKVAELPGGKEVWNLCISFKQIIPMQKIQIENFINDYGNEIKNSWIGKTATT